MTLNSSGPEDPKTSAEFLKAFIGIKNLKQVLSFLRILRDSHSEKCVSCHPKMENPAPCDFRPGGCADTFQCIIQSWRFAASSKPKEMASGPRNSISDGFSMVKMMFMTGQPSTPET